MNERERTERASFFRKPSPPGGGPMARAVAPAARPPAPPPSPPLPPAPPLGSEPPRFGPPPPLEVDGVRNPVFHGSGGTLFGIHVVNALLILVTLGIYYFWAKTRVRRYLASQAEMELDRFAYHGTAKELLLGTLKAVVGARRYRLSRTSWRGIRFSFRGQVWDLVKIFIIGSFLTGLTLGLYYP